MKIKHKKSRWEEIPEVIQNQIGDILEAGGFLVEGDAKRLCPVDTGRLRSSIHTRKEDWNKVIVGTDVEYAPYVEYGTPPHMPPVEALKRWASRHKMGEKAAWALAKTIEKHGTQPQPFMRPALAGNRQKIQELFTRRFGEIIRKYQI